MMKRSAIGFAFSAAMLLAACEGQADENLAAAAENGAAAVGEGIEQAADEAGNTLEKAGDAVSNQAAKLENGVDVDVDVNASGNAATGNSH